MSFQNKFQNAYINTTTNSSYLITSNFQGDNSLVNKGKSEFEDNVVFDQRVAIGKATDASYALDVSGNVRINGGTVPTLTNDLVFLGNLQATKPVGIGKVYALGYALDISGNVRIANGNLTGGGVVSVSNQNTFTANQTFNNPVGFGKIWDSVYAIDVSGSVRITGGSVIGGNVASIKTDNSYDGKQTFLSQVGIRKTWDNAFSLDVSGNMRIANGNLTGGNVASLIAQNTFTMRNRFNDALTINCNFSSYQLDVSGNLRVANGTSTFEGNVAMTGTQATVTNNPINDSGIVNRGYANTNYARLTINNIYTGNQDWKGNNNSFDYAPICGADPTDPNHLCRKSYVDNAFVNYATSNTTYSGFNIYDPHLPTSTVTPTLPEQFTTKAYVDSVAATGATTTAVNTWTNTNTFQGEVYFENQVGFSNYVPYCNINATADYDLANKSYVDTQKTYLLTNNNTWTNFNTFQEDIGIQGNNVTFSITTATSFLGSASFANPPTCEVEPVNENDLCRKSYVDVVFDPSYNQLLDYTNQQIDERGLYPLGDDNYRFQTNLTGVVAGNRNSAYGFGAGNGIVSGWNNVCLGYNAGQNVGSDTSNCIFLGSNSDASGGTYNNSIAIGSNVSVSGSNQIRIGTTAHTTEIRGEVALRGQVLNSILDVSNNFTMSPLGYIPYQYYAVDASATITATLSTSSGLLGQTATFRRVGGNTTAQVLSASSNIYPLNSFTATNVILDASENLVRITRLRNSAGTAGWYKM